MAYTFLEFQQIVTRMIRLNAGNNDFASAIKDSINIALYDISREQQWTDLLKVRQAVSLATVASGNAMPLPADFMSIERVRFTDTSSTRTWALSPRKGRIPPAPIWGQPRAYEITTAGATSGIIIEPFNAVSSGTDVLLVDYYATAATLVNDGDKPVGSTWDAEIIRRAEHYMFTYLNRIEQAKLMVTPKPVAPETQ